MGTDCDFVPSQLKKEKKKEKKREKNKTKRPVPLRRQLGVKRVKLNKRTFVWAGRHKPVTIFTNQRDGLYKPTRWSLQTNVMVFTNQRHGLYKPNPSHVFTNQGHGLYKPSSRSLQTKVKVFGAPHHAKR